MVTISIGTVWTVIVGGGALVGALLNYRRAYRIIRRILNKRKNTVN